MLSLFIFLRSPNRKLREATDRVGDKLRAYAQKFKVIIKRFSQLIMRTLIIIFVKKKLFKL